MKKVILTIVALAAGVAVNAQNNSVKIENTERPSVYNLVYKAETAGKVTVKITDQTGHVVLVDELYGKNFARPYNFNSVPTGKFNIEVSDKKTSETLSLVHNYASITPIHEVAVKAIENNKYELTVIGNKSDNVVVNIYDKNNELIHSDLIDKKGSFSRVYDLNKIKASGYTFEVSVADKIVSKVALQ